MFRFFPKLWQTVSLLGTYDGMELGYHRRVILSNRVSLFLAIFSIQLGCLTFAVNGPAYGGIAGFGMGLVFVVLPILTGMGHFRFSRFLLTTLPGVLISAISLVIKLSATGPIEVYQYFIPKFLMLVPAIIPLVLFDQKDKIGLRATILFNLFLLVTFDLWHNLLGVDALQTGTLTDSRHYILVLPILLIAIAVMASIQFLLRINYKYEKQILQLLNEQKKKSHELHIKERTLSDAYNQLQATEEEMRQNTHQLEEEIRYRREKEVELVAERKRAESAAKAKEDFLSMMSHEIRTPMNAVIGMTHLLIEDHPKPEQEENLKILQLSAENLLSLVNDILDFNKIEAGKIILEETEYDLEELLLNIKSSFHKQAAQQQLKLRTFLDPAIPRKLIGDPVRLSQVLYNLVSNAIKFTEKGSVTVSIKSLEQDDSSVTLKFSVLDTGIGISQENMDSIFESFVQANSGITRKFGGSGLGLSIVKRLLELMDSQIMVKSEQGHGSDFYFIIHIPISTLSEANKSALKPIESPDLEGLRVLIVEDNAVNQMVIRKFLRKWNAHMDSATNGVEALKKMEISEFDLVLMDLQMPEMDGYTTTKKIRSIRRGNMPTIPIIALTASVQLDSKHRVFEVGMNDFVSKPFDPEDLLNKIKMQIAAQN